MHIDEETMDGLTVLAREVFPDSYVEFGALKRSIGVYTEVDPALGVRRTELYIGNHPRSANALQAALRAMRGK